MNSTAIIQFIGLVLFSNAVQTDPGVHAILPRVDHMAMHDTLSPGDGKNQKNENPVGVERHAAVILYRTDDLISTTRGWKRGADSLKNGWDYVELDGEELQFVSTARNEDPEIPRDLPRAITPNSRCLLASAQPVQLTQAFQAPNYKGAVGVIDIPFGVLKACNARSRTDNNRTDTTLLLQTNGTLVIIGKKPEEARGKTITLAGDAIVYVANVPPHYLFTGIAEPPVGEPHFMAYTAMLDTPCTDPPQNLQATQMCDLSAINTAWKIAQNNPPSTKWQIFDSSCTNTQWP